jgi:ribose transport system ATP-binding protein
VTKSPAVVIENVSKSFAGNPALTDFSLRLRSGETHALVGQNGSGKSTLIKILSGYHSPDFGRVEIDGEELKFSSPSDAFRLGCRFVHQDLGLIREMSILDNFLLTTGFPTRLGTVRTRAARRAAEEELSSLGIRFDLRKPTSTLSPAQRTELAFARALRPVTGFEPRLLVLDEPTATLPIDEVDHLLETVRTAATRGVAVLYVTHHLDEVFRVADSVTVLRDGNTMQTSPLKEVRRKDLVEQLIGDEFEPVAVEERIAKVNSNATVLDIRDLVTDVLRGVSLTVRKGEIVGLAGLTGSGRESVLGAVFGSEERLGGEVQVDGAVLRSGRPDLAIAAGVAYVPADRKTQGVIMTLSARENISLTDFAPFWSGRWLNRRRERAHSQRWFDELSVRPRDGLEMLLESFSGGNQQKILFAKWLRRNPSLILSDDPTQGVDVGAKAELHRCLEQAAEGGAAVVISSTDVDELVTLCDRVLIFRDGTISDEIGRSILTTQHITERILSSESVERTG